MSVPQTADAVVIGAGIVGACCTHFLTEAGLRVAVIDSGPVAGGTTGAGEGNILVSDKEPGPELGLALLSNRLWRELAETPKAELEPKGGLVVAAEAQTWAGLQRLADEQRQAGVAVEDVAADRLADLEPHLTRNLAGGAFYSQDMQVQPMIATALLLRRCRERGATVHTGCRAVEIVTGADGAVRGVQTTEGLIAAPLVVNAAGTWGGEVAELAGVHLPVMPRRGFILVTEPLPPLIRHKVYSADYVSNVASDSSGLETSAVVEGTKSGTVLIGASRERVGFDRSMPVPVLARLARQAISLFPFLAEVSLLRAYRGFRPYCPDHLPVIGPDPRVPGLSHACGHEGAGIGLAPATGLLIAQAATGQQPELPLEPFAPDRFGASDAA